MSLDHLLLKIVGLPVSVAPDGAPLSDLLFFYTSARAGDRRTLGELIDLARPDHSDWREQETAQLLLFALWKERPAALPPGIFERIESALPPAFQVEGAELRTNLRRSVLRLFPKVELHTHLDGSVRPQTILELSRQQRINLREVIEELPLDYTLADIERMAIFPPGAAPEDFGRFLLQRFALPLAVMQTEAGLERTAFELVREAYLDGVSHLEARFAPCIHQRGHLSYDNIIDAVVRGLLWGQDTFGVSTAVILCLYRNYREVHQGHFLLTANAALRAAGRYQGRIGVGLDLAGLEIGYPPRDAEAAYALTFDQPPDLRVFRTVHAGEMQSTLPYIDQAVERLRPHRFGHGNQLATILGDDFKEETYRRIVGQIPLELCPTSNVQLGSTEGGLASHPLLRLHRAGFLVTINPDNRTVSGTTMTGEFLNVVERMGMPLVQDEQLADDVLAMTRNAAGAAFLPDGAKAALMDRINGALPDLQQIVRVLSPYL